MDQFRFNDYDDCELKIGPHGGSLRVRTVDAFGAGAACDLKPDNVDELIGYLQEWRAARRPESAPLTPADVRHIVNEHLATALPTVLPLYLAPQAQPGYVDAAPGCACHDNEGNSILPDPEPRDVGHPEQDLCELVRPLNANQDDRCAQCDFKWRDHSSFCTECGHHWGNHMQTKIGCIAILGKGRCECTNPHPLARPR